MGAAASVSTSAWLDYKVICASKDGDVERLRTLLLDDQVNVNCCDADGWTPLMLACKYGHVGVVQLLLDSFADVKRTNFLGLAAMHYAVFRESPGIIGMLLKAENSCADLLAKEQETLINKTALTVPNPLASAQLTQ